MRNLLLPVLAGLTLVTTGCAQLQLSPPKASIDNVQKVRSAGMAPVAVGTFTLDPKQDPAMDKAISMRGANTAKSPVGGSFAQYLKGTLAAELQAAGLLDPASNLVISGFLTESSVETTGTGTGTLGARFVVTRNGAVAYEQELKVSSTWQSSFMAAVAVPAAAGEYELLYRKLVAALLDDPAFRRAVAP